MKKDLLEVMPEFNLIDNADLREKTIKTWLEALRRGGWNVGDLGRIPFTLLLDPCPVSIVEHNRGVVGVAAKTYEVLSKIYGERIPLDKDILISGAILHDVGKLLEYREENGHFTKSHMGSLVRHPISGASLCAEMGLPDEVVHIVAVHSHEGDRVKRTPEAVIVHHADFTNFETLH